MIRLLLFLTLIFGSATLLFVRSDSPIVAFAAILLLAPVMLVAAKVAVERGR